MARYSVITPEARMGFCALKEPVPNLRDQMKYTATLMFGEDVDLSHLQAAVAEVAEEKWGANAKKVMASPQFFSPFRDGNEKADTRPEYAGTTFIKAQSDYQPGTVDRYKDPNTGRARVIADPDEIYAGCYARASLTPFAWEYAGKKGVSFFLKNVQKLKDGERLGGSRRAEDEFDALEGGPAVLNDDEPFAA